MGGLKGFGLRRKRGGGGDGKWGAGVGVWEELTHFCFPILPSSFWNPCTKAGMASRAEELRDGLALIVVREVMSYSAHWR